MQREGVSQKLIVWCFYYTCSFIIVVIDIYWNARKNTFSYSNKPFLLLNLRSTKISFPESPVIERMVQKIEHNYDSCSPLQRIFKKKKVK